MAVKISTDPLQWILAPVQNLILKVIGFFWACMWGMAAVLEFPDLTYLPELLLFGHLMAFLMWPLSLVSPYTFVAPFATGYLIWALLYDIHPPLLLFLILSLMSSWVTFVFNDFDWQGGWHSIPMLVIPIVLLIWAGILYVRT